jgi:hypothetical protein
MGLIQRDYVSVNHNIVVLLCFILYGCTQHIRVLIFILGRAGVILMGSMYYLIRRPLTGGKW